MERGYANKVRVSRPLRESASVSKKRNLNKANSRAEGAYSKRKGTEKTEAK